MPETEIMKTVDLLLLELDTVVNGPIPGRVATVRRISDELAESWERHRAELVNERIHRTYTHREILRL